MIYLKQSTASQEVVLGPFVDSTDGVTAETGLTIANTDIKIWKSGTTTFANKNSGGGTHISGGNYHATLDATDTDTLGSGALIVQVSGALAVRHNFTILAANVYDSLIGGGDLLDVNTSQLGGTAQTAKDVGAAVPAAAAGAAGGLFIAGSNAATTVNITGNITGNLSGSVGSVTASVNVGQIAGQTANAAGAVTFPSAVASTTNITGGTITTVTNLTNAPTNGDLTATMKASVNAEVLDVLATDTFAQPGQEAPAATATLKNMVAYLYKAWRNKSTQTSSQYSLYADDTTTIDQKATVGDDGTTFTRGEVATGP